MHYFHNFKNFADSSIELMRPMTLLIGRNGAGKSNAIEGVELLGEIARGRPLFEITDVGQGNAGTFELRGGLLGCLRTGQGAFSLRFDAAIPFDGVQQNFSYEVAVKPDRGGRISEEKLVVGGRLLFGARQGKNPDIVDVTFDNFKRGPNKPTEQLSADRSVLSRYGDFGPEGGTVKARDAHLVVRGIEGHLKASFVFDPHPHAMRDYARVGQTQLLRDGGNLSSVLHSLSFGDENARRTLAGIRNRIRQVPEEPFEDFEFITTDIGDVMMALKRADGTRVNARLLSDGTLRALAVLTAMETAPEGSRIVVEELENGLHPSRVEVLVDALWRLAQQRKLNVLATTHNPATLNKLTREQIRSVVVCHYDTASGGAKFSPLMDLAGAASLVEGGNLGDLVTREVLDRYLSPQWEEERRKEMEKWLDSLPSSAA